jgi:hypothetical protein
MMSGEPAVSPGEPCPELRSWAHERRSKILECLGREAHHDPDAAMEYVILVAARYRRFVFQYRDAPTRSALRAHLCALRDAVRTASGLLNSEDSWLLAALSLGGLLETEARALDRGSGSKIKAALRHLENATEAALKMLPLSGAAGGQKPMLSSAQTLVLDCAAIFEKYRPSEIERPRHRGAGFPIFVNTVYEIATGQVYEVATARQVALRRAIRNARAAVRERRVTQPAIGSATDESDLLSDLWGHLKTLVTPRG